MSKGGNLGKASLILGTQDKGLGSGLADAKSKITGWAGGIKGAVAGVLGFAGIALAGFSAKAIAGGIGDLAAVGKQARNLGVASDTFMGLGAAAHAAGVEQDEFAQHLLKAQGKIAGGGEEINHALGQIGLSVESLRGKSPDAQFFAIAKGLEGISDQGMKAHIATQLYEREGIKLLPVLMKGEAGLKSYIETQKKLGVAIGPGDMASVMRAQVAITNVKKLGQGVWNKILVTAAPILEGIANVVDRVMTRIQPGIAWVQRLVGTMTEIGGPAVVAAFDVVMGFVGEVGSGLGALYEPYIGQLPSVEEGTTRVMRALGIASAQTWDQMKTGAGKAVVGLSHVVSGFVAISTSINDLIKLLPQLGKGFDTYLGDYGAGVGRLKEKTSGMLGDTKAQDLWDAYLGKTIEATETLRSKTAGAFGGDYLKKFADDNEKELQRISKLNLEARAWGQKQIADNGKSADGVRAWFDGEKWKQKPEDKKPIADAIAAAFKYEKNQAIEKGSKEDYSARVRWEQQSQSAQEKQLAEARKANGQLGDLNGGVKAVLGAIQNMATISLGSV